MVNSPIRRFPAQAVIGLIQSHYEKDDEKFESYAKEIEYFLNEEGREGAADYIHSLRTGTGFVPMGGSMTEACKYCEKEKGCLVFSTVRGCFGRVMGDKWGRSGFTVNKKNWVHAAGIVRTQDGEYRIKISDIMTPPISYCPKCGRKLSW